MTDMTPSKALEAAIRHAPDVAENWMYEEGATPPDTAALTLSKLRELGYVLAPVEASKEMVAAGEDAKSDRYALRPAPDDIYRAMIREAGNG